MPKAVPRAVAAAVVMLDGGMPKPKAVVAAVAARMDPLAMVLTEAEMARPVPMHEAVMVAQVQTAPVVALVVRGTVAAAVAAAAVTPAVAAAVAAVPVVTEVLRMTEEPAQVPSVAPVAVAMLTVSLLPAATAVMPSQAVMATRVKITPSRLGAAVAVPDPVEQQTVVAAVAAVEPAVEPLAWWLLNAW